MPEAAPVTSARAPLMRMVVDGRDRGRSATEDAAVGVGLGGRGDALGWRQGARVGTLLSALLWVVLRRDLGVALALAISHRIAVLQHEHQVVCGVKTTRRN